MRRVAATFGPNIDTGVCRVVDASDLANEWTPDLRFLVRIRAPSDREGVERLSSAGTTNVGWVQSDELLAGDVVSPRVSKSVSLVHFRESDVHHTLFLTNRCNSYCLMCSQPPTAYDDSWLVAEAIEIVRHMRISPRVIGLTGGEPLLLGRGLRRILDSIASHHPKTAIEVLTNARLLSGEALVDQTLNGLGTSVSWLVPLYGHADFLHDFVVQSPGAFDETLGGLLALQERKQPIQLRVVLITPVLQVLPELCRFIARNLPFVREVALMACEPTGFALANREHCEADLTDWSESLSHATRELARHRVPFIFMNAPLCALPRHLWDHAHKSISDWKNVYASECARCAVKDRCSGLFAWHEKGWKPSKIRPIEGVAA